MRCLQLLIGLISAQRSVTANGNHKGHGLLGRLLRREHHRHTGDNSPLSSLQKDVFIGDVTHSQTHEQEETETHSNDILNELVKEAPIATNKSTDLSFCTLVDGRTTPISLEAKIVHLVSSIDAAGAFIFVDCRGAVGQSALLRARALRKRYNGSFSVACVDTTNMARREWSQLWVAEPSEAIRHWPEQSYKGILRLALHQCFWRSCKTQYCAWSDSDMFLIPKTNVSWTGSLRNCLQSSPQHSVFAMFGARDEFSSQVFVVNRTRLFHEWLPFPPHVLYKWYGSFIGRDDGYPMQMSGMEAMVVGKESEERSRCATCDPTSFCPEKDATAYHSGDLVQPSAVVDDRFALKLVRLNNAFRKGDQHRSTAMRLRSELTNVLDVASLMPFCRLCGRGSLETESHDLRRCCALISRKCSIWRRKYSTAQVESEKEQTEKEDVIKQEQVWPCVKNDMVQNALDGWAAP